jgi:hypothetical protein
MQKLDSWRSRASQILHKSEVSTWWTIYTHTVCIPGTHARAHTHTHTVLSVIMNKEHKQWLWNIQYPNDKNNKHVHLTQQDSSTTSASLCFHSHMKKLVQYKNFIVLTFFTATFFKTAYICNYISRDVSVFKVAFSTEKLIKHQMRLENDHS